MKIQKPEARSQYPQNAEQLSAVEREAWAALEADTRTAYAEATALLYAAVPSLVFSDLACTQAADTNPAACRALLLAGVPSAYDLARNALQSARLRRKKRH